MIIARRRSMFDVAFKCDSLRSRQDFRTPKPVSTLTTRGVSQHYFKLYTAAIQSIPQLLEEE